MALATHALATVDEVKEELNLQGTARDTVIEECIHRATGIVEAHLDREVRNRLSGTVATTVTEVYSFEGASRSLYLAQFPVISVSSVGESTAWPRDYSTPLVADTDYVLEPAKGRLVRIASGGLSTWASGFRTVQVVYKPGYAALADVPYSIRDVTRRFAALQYRELDRAQQGVSAYSDSLGNVTRFGPARLTLDMAEQLAPFRRYLKTDAQSYTRS